MKGEHLYRRLTAFIFIAAFLAQTFSRSFIIADYYADTAKYARNCVNKAKPKMNCNGKCQMMKKLQEEEKKDQENPDRKQENKNEVVLSSKSFFAHVPVTVTVLTAAVQPPAVSDNQLIDRSFDIFHPPRA